MLSDITGGRSGRTYKEMKDVQSLEKWRLVV